MSNCEARMEELLFSTVKTDFIKSNVVVEMPLQETKETHYTFYRWREIREERKELCKTGKQLVPLYITSIFNGLVLISSSEL
ncbi:hypothetical protein HZH66_011998 [Vespula vulgaris]|uniref:Uncharacterized protein n=1 Tax=Vespula vulgaris TaxID=7454 RepID=A0A834JD14_VESVU|nr:hypothetical protein HZH66_011998 [Vespula vulgaris]